MRQVNVSKYYPSVTKSYREIEKIPLAENSEFSLIWSKIGYLWDDQFILTLQLTGILRWEKILKIIPKVNHTQEERRKNILIKINEQIPYTYRRMIQILDILCGANLYDIDLIYNKYLLNIIVNPDSTNNIDSIARILNPIVPANLTMFIAMQIFLFLKIRHQAEAIQIVDANHNVWNLGAVKFVRRDGIYYRNKLTRRNGIQPDGGYRTKQNHRAEIDLLINGSQKNNGQIVNCRNGNYVRNASHRRNGIYTKMAMLANYCTVSHIKNGVEVTECV